MISVVNKRTHHVHGMSVYVGRPSALGNPLVVGRDGTREDVVEGYRSWLNRMIVSNNREVMLELHYLEQTAKAVDLSLVCWCAPLSCHADVIAEVVQRRIDTGRWSVTP